MIDPGKQIQYQFYNKLSDQFYDQFAHQFDRKFWIKLRDQSMRRPDGYLMDQLWMQLAGLNYD